LRVTSIWSYHTASELAKTEELGVEVLVAIPEQAKQTEDPKYNINNFEYHQEGGYFVCPQGETLNTNGNWYNKSYGKKKSTVRVKHYKTTACKTCPVFSQCTKNQSGRLIERNEHQAAAERNKQRIEQNKELYRKRQEIVEHPFGVIKRQWGFSYIMTKRTMKRASADVGLIFCAYNLRRIFNLIDRNVLKAWLKGLILIFPKNTDHFKLNTAFAFFKTKFVNLFYDARIAA
jgi:hypothetical protein